MDNNPNIIRKEQLARWLLTISLVCCLLSLSARVSAYQQTQTVSTEIFQPNHSRAYSKAIDHYCEFFQVAVNKYQPKTENKHFVLLSDLLVNTRFSYLAIKFSAIRQAVQKPCIAFIFHHSGQK